MIFGLFCYKVEQLIVNWPFSQVHPSVASSFRVPWYGCLLVVRWVVGSILHGGHIELFFYIFCLFCYKVEQLIVNWPFSQVHSSVASSFRVLWCDGSSDRSFMIDIEVFLMMFCLFCYKVEQLIVNWPFSQVHPSVASSFRVLWYGRSLVV